MQPLFVTYLSFPAAQCENNRSPHSSRSTGSRYRSYIDGHYGKRELPYFHCPKNSFESQTMVELLPAKANRGAVTTLTHAMTELENSFIWCPSRSRPEKQNIQVACFAPSQNMFPQTVITCCGGWFDPNNPRQVSGQHPGAEEVRQGAMTSCSGSDMQRGRDILKQAPTGPTRVKKRPSVVSEGATKPHSYSTFMDLCGNETFPAIKCASSNWFTREALLWQHILILIHRMLIAH